MLAHDDNCEPFRERHLLSHQNALFSELNEIGTVHDFERNAEIFEQGEVTHYWFRVISGVVRLSNLLADGRRQIIEFCYSGDFFGLEKRAERFFSAEAVNNVVIMRYPRRPLEQLLSKCPHLMYVMHHIAQRDLANAQMRIVLLGRMNAAERVATFLLYMLERSDAQDAVDLPMSRGDIADYLGLTIETVSRVITAFKRTGIISIPQSEHIELRDRAKLQAIIAGAGYSHLSFLDDDSRPPSKSRLPTRLSAGIADRSHRDIRLYQDEELLLHSAKIFSTAGATVPEVTSENSKYQTVDPE